MRRRCSCPRITNAQAAVTDGIYCASLRCLTARKAAAAPTRSRRLPVPWRGDFRPFVWPSLPPKAWVTGQPARDQKHGDARTRGCAAAIDDGGIDLPDVRPCRDASPRRHDGTEQAAAALANLARESEDNRNSILNTDGIPPIPALDSKSPTAKENAVVAITELARGSMENQAAVAAAGGVKKIVGLMHGFSAQTKDTAAWRLCALAAAAIRELSRGDGESVNSENQDAIAQAGAMAPLVTMLGVPSPQLQANVAAAMASLSKGHHGNQLAISSWARSLRYWASCERALQTSRTAPRPPSGRSPTRMFTIRIRLPNWAASIH